MRLKKVECFGKLVWLLNTVYMLYFLYYSTLSYRLIIGYVIECIDEIHLL